MWRDETRRDETRRDETRWDEMRWGEVRWNGMGRRIWREDKCPITALYGTDDTALMKTLTKHDVRHQWWDSPFAHMYIIEHYPYVMLDVRHWWRLYMYINMIKGVDDGTYKYNINTIRKIFWPVGVCVVVALVLGLYDGRHVPRAGRCVPQTSQWIPLGGCLRLEVKFFRVGKERMTMIISYP